MLRRVYRPSIHVNHLTPAIRSVSGFLVTTIEKEISLISPRRFRFYGEEGDLQSVGWTGNKKERLWRYNQHYFDDLNGKNPLNRRDWHRDLLSDWLLVNSYAGGVGWEPYPLSLRVVNWIKWDLAEGELSDDCRESLYSQGLTLEKNIEYHILGNHLFANAKALIFLGCYFEGLDAKRWLDKGSKIIIEELKVQVLCDGGHYELSPMYHCIFLEDILDLINILSAYQLINSEKTLVSLKKVIPSMLTWMREMTFDDGAVSCFNDSATNIAPNPTDLEKYAAKLGLHSLAKARLTEIHYKHLVGSGYIAVTRGDVKLVLDVARLGPDYLLAHAHADNLAFEMSSGKQRIFVNSGTSCYGTSDRRSFERSTKAHNTVEVDQDSSSEVWETFRVARRAYPFGLKIDESDGGLSVECSHNGYKRLHGAPIHTRNWIIEKEKVTVRDTVTGGFRSAISRFIFHPGILITQKDETFFSLTSHDGVDLLLCIKRGTAKLVNWRTTTEFGFLSDSHCLEIALVNGESRVEIV